GSSCRLEAGRGCGEGRLRRAPPGPHPDGCRRLQDPPPPAAAPAPFPPARRQGSRLQRLVLYPELRRSKREFDELVEDKGVKILVEPKALMHVIGTKMDFVDDKLRSEFIFINPNSKGQCGCGESFMTTSRSEAVKRGGS
ncbi:Fe-S_biosyn domain-containing protein, partial [Psidium guajava]